MAVVPVVPRRTPSLLVVLTMAGLATPLATTGAQAGAGTATLVGRITESGSGTPIAGARVQATAIPARTAAGAVNSGADGRYRLAGLQPGRYAVTVSRIGYRMRRVDTVAVAAGQTVTLNETLEELPSQLNQVVTTASRAPEKILEAPASVSVVNAQQIEQRPSVTAIDHLRDTPGLDVSTGGIAQSNVVARGFNNAFSGSLLTLQDYRFAGVPSLRVNVPFLFTGTNEDIERIEVVLGPASALYGPNSANGVLHVITKSPLTSQGTTITVDGGERSIFRGSLRHAQKLGERFGFKLSGEYFTGRDFAFTDRAEPTTFPNDPSVPASRRGQPNPRNLDLERYTAEVRTDWRPSDRVEAITTVGYTDVGNGIELTGANGASQIRNWTYTNLQQRVRVGKLFVQAFANLSDAGNRDARDDRGTFIRRTGAPIVDQSRVFVGQVQHALDLGGDRQRFVYGVDYIFTNPRTGNTINGRNEADDDVTETGAYLQSTTRLSPRFDFLAAARIDRNDRIAGTQFSPRAAVVFKPSPKHNLRATYNRAFQTPANFSFFLDLGQGVNVGGSGFNVRARGNPPKEGWQYARSCTPAVAGGLCMRSQLVGGGQFVPATAAAALPAFITVRQAALVQGLVANGVPAAQAQAIVDFLRTRTPSATDIATRLAFITDPGSVNRAPSSFQDIAPLAASFNNTYELGYKGLIGQRARLAVDLWHQQRGDVGTPASIATPNVFLDGPSLAAYLTTQLANGAGLPAATAEQIARALAPQLARAPLGLVTFANGSTNATDIVATYQSLNKRVNLSGVDVGLDYLLTSRVSLVATYGYASRRVFEDVRSADGSALMLNAPNHRATLAGRLEPAGSRGFGLELRGRYTNAFPVNSGVFQSGRPFPVPGVQGVTYQYDPVPVNLLVDAGVSYRFELNGRRALWSLNGTNVLDNARPTFAGVPAIGRVVMTRLQYTL